MSASLGNATVTMGLEKVNFPPSPKERAMRKDIQTILQL